MRCNLFFLSLLIYACDLSLPYKNYIDKVCFFCNPHGVNCIHAACDLLLQTLSMLL